MNVMIAYQTEHILGALLELRDIERLEKKVSLLIRSRGWSHVIDVLQICKESEAIVPGWDTPLREGILREGMIELLLLESFVGLDVDFLEAFSDLEADDIDDLRKQVHKRAFKLLGAQVRKGNTFFIDIEGMKDKEFAVLVPDILNSRIREVQDLGSKPDLYEVYSTYYGFQVLTSGVNIKYAGVPVELRENLQSILSDLGGVDALSAKQLKFSLLAFRKCSPHLTVLLWNMLRLSNGGMKAKSKALEALGELADSRAIGLLHMYVKTHESAYHRSKEYRLVEECLLCLGRIGNHHSFEILRDIPTEIGNIALGGIRHPIAQKVFENETNRSLGLYSRQMVQLLKALSNTRSRHWLSFYEAIRQKYRSGGVHEAIDHAERNVHPPFDNE